VPRSNRSQPDTPTRARSRGPARSSARRSGSADATADMSTATQSGDVSYNPSFDEIAEAAYQRYLKRGATDGQDFDDWLEAERELKSRRSS
jgi:hypothetical protein